jgi:tetratricopeptide (TPR) repeat protein
VATLAEEASFMPALVEVTFPASGARAVRAAFEALPPVPATAWVRCRDLSAAESFLATADERTFLASIAEFRTADALSPAQSALLRALEHSGLVEVLSPEEWEARAGADRVEAARRAEEESRREAARLALEAARAAEDRRQAERLERADAARRALEAAKAAEAAWRRARDETGNGQASVPAVHTTEREFPGPPVHGTPPEFPAGAPAVHTTAVEFHVLSEDMPPLESMPPPSDEPGVPVLTRTTLAPFEAPVPSTDPMGLPPVATSLGDEDTLVRAMQQARGQTDPFAPMAPTPARPCRAASAASFGDGSVRARRRAGTADDRTRRHSAQHPGAGHRRAAHAAVAALRLPSGGGNAHPPAGTSEARTPPGASCSSPRSWCSSPRRSSSRGGARPPRPRERWSPSSARRSRRLGGAPELFQAPSTEAVGSKPAERTPLRHGPESGESDADLWKLVSGAQGEQPGSFEAALRQVDGQLEALAGLRAPNDPENPSTVPLRTTDLDALVRASFESGEWTMAPPISEKDTSTDSGRIGLAALSGTPVPGPPPPTGASPEPPELPAARRQELLRQARAAAEREPVASIPTPPPRSLEDAELAEAIEARHAALTGDPDRFAVLGLSPAAGRDDVKRAFIELAKAFHPDRLPRSLHMLQPKAARVFDAIREAQEFLLDDLRRAEHAVAHAGGGPARTSDPAAAAEALVAGEMAMRRREYAQAEAFFRQAHEADPRPATLAAAAWAIYMDPSRRAEASQARAMMVDALKADPDCDRAHYQLGVIARVEGGVDRAEKHFREAVRSNPRHLEAAQELRLLEMRRRPKKK